MNPVDKVDDLLAKAGAQWRAGQPSPPEPELDRITQGKRPHRWVPVLAAASVAAIAIAALVVLPGHKDAPQLVAPSNEDPLLVHNGDKVEVSGQVIAAAGKQPVFCPAVPQNAVGYLPGKEPAPTCPPNLEVQLTGVDLDRLSNPSTIKGTRSGQAHLVGIWNDRKLAVQQQSVPLKEQPVPEPKIPCDPPAGGWQPGGIVEPGGPAVDAFFNARGAELEQPAMRYPLGQAVNAPVVLMVGVAHGNVDAVRQAIKGVYTGNVCVFQAKYSRNEVTKSGGAVSALMAQKDLGIFGTGQSVGDHPVSVDLLVYDEAAKAALAPIGLDILDLRPEVKRIS
ncbi:hypothetical protein GCM10009744_57720 [Kribbella alba]|uniref:Uncharacterized protein n=1 Tax=Kribbella alba TaxID=190197 RepID=A0ABN2FRB0_9ACTN